MDDTTQSLETIRKRIEHEDNLLNQRVSWIVSSQAFLLTGYAILLNGPQVLRSEQFERTPRPLQYQRRDYAPEAVPATLVGVGVLQCTMHASLNIWAPKGPGGRPLGMGARGRDGADYHGEAFTASGTGTARVVAFSPNEIVVEVAGARVGDRLIINQNFDPGWRVDGRPAESYRDALASTLPTASGRYTFRFWPRGLTLGLCALVLTLCGLGFGYWRRARAARLSP